MNKLVVRFGTTIATAATFAALAAPTFAANITNVGGGAFSTSGVTVNKLKMLTLMQNNATNVSTVVSNSSNSGNNHNSFNTGGTNGIGTGPSTTSVAVGVTGNGNVAVNGCGCVPAAPSTITNVGGGAFSSSGITLNSTHLTTLGQNNSTTVGTTVVTSTNSGGNTSMFNTNGNTGIGTGASSTGVVVSVGGSTNQAAL